MNGKTFMMLRSTIIIVWLLCLLAFVNADDLPTVKDRKLCVKGDAAPATRVVTTGRLKEFRKAMSEIKLPEGGTPAAFIVGSGDAHGSEYPPDYAKRRGYISGFSGSAGTAVITATKAALWTDGRYFVAAEEQLDCNWILMKGYDQSIGEWLSSVLPKDKKSVVAMDQSLASSADFDAREKDLKKWSSNLALTTIASKFNPVDKIWTTAKGRPAQPKNAINPLAFKFAGKKWEDKVKDLRTAMKKQNAIAFVVTSLDEVAWLLNLRGTDIVYNPVVISYAIVETNKVHLYILDKDKRLESKPDDPESLKVTLAKHLCTTATGMCTGKVKQCCVQVHEYSQANIETAAKTLADTGKVWVTHSANYGIYKAVSKNVLVDKSPIALAKSKKNKIEIKGMQRAYNTDSVVLIKFLAYLEKQIKDGKKWTEMNASKELDNRRKQAKYSRGLSFKTISGYGSNGAIIHYTAVKATSKVISTDSTYLLDSGGQYLDGTTDVTRTMHFGKPTAHQKECYTRVLASVINLAGLQWPDTYFGHQIDVMARYQMWEGGLYYNHGTGHGVGAYLYIHEGPGSIGSASKPAIYQEKLAANQFYSDEPGYYEEGKFGIRLETVMRIVPHKHKVKITGSPKFLAFQAVQFVPFEPNLIDYSLLTVKQKKWLNKYNADIKEVITPSLKGDKLAMSWLNERTKPIEVEHQHTDAAGLLKPSLILTLSSILLATWKIFA